jgi:hypothetical protein
MTRIIEPPQAPEKLPAFRFSPDACAISLALGLSFLIWIGVIKHVPW